MKYGKRVQASPAVAHRLLEAIRGRWAGRFPDGFRPAIVPVPIRPLKYLRRGFNLPALLGACLAKRLGWPLFPALLMRDRERRPQAGLPATARGPNVQGAFRVSRRARVPADILILDDVYTSGATASECARALKTAGAAHIVVLTVARTPP